MESNKKLVLKFAIAVALAVVSLGIFFGMVFYMAGVTTEGGGVDTARAYLSEIDDEYHAIRNSEEWKTSLDKEMKAEITEHWKQERGFYISQLYTINGELVVFFFFSITLLMAAGAFLTVMSLQLKAYLNGTSDQRLKAKQKKLQDKIAKYGNDALAKPDLLNMRQSDENGVRPLINIVASMPLTTDDLQTAELEEVENENYDEAADDDNVTENCADETAAPETDENDVNEESIVEEAKTCDEHKPMRCPVCGGDINITDEAILSCSECGKRYKNPYVNK